MLDDRKVWFYEIQNDGYDPDKISGGIRPETPSENDIPELLELWKKYKETDYKEPPGLNVILKEDFEDFEEHKNCWWVNIDQLRDNEYNLTAGRYKPVTYERVFEFPPEVLIEEILEIEDSITKDLKNLLKDIEG